MLDFILDPILGPLLRLEPMFAIILISVIMSFLVTYAYKKLTDQSLMKDLKQEIKDLQGEMKKLKNNPKKLMEVNRKAMETNTKYMMHSLKPTLYTFIPIIIIFSWLNAHMGYFPIVEGQDFAATVVFEENIDGTITLHAPSGVLIVGGEPQQQITGGKAEWTLQAQAGQYNLSYEFNGNDYQRPVTITDSITDRRYEKPEMTARDYKNLSDSGIESLSVGNEKIKPFQRLGILGDIPWIGGFGWLGTYILFSIISSIVIRKLMKVY